MTPRHCSFSHTLRASKIVGLEFKTKEMHSFKIYQRWRGVYQWAIKQLTPKDYPVKME